MAKCALKFLFAFLLAVCLVITPLVGFPQAGVSGLLTDDDLVVTNELADGQALVYAVSAGSEDSAETIAANTQKISRILYSRLVALGIRDAKVTVLSDRTLAIVLPYNSESAAINNTVGARGAVSFRTTQSTTASAFLTNEDIESVRVTYTANTSGNPSYYLNFHLTDEGMKKYTEKTTEAASSTRYVYVYVDDELISSVNVTEAVTENDFSIGSLSQDTAVVAAMLINSGVLPYEITGSAKYVTAVNQGSYKGLFIGLFICAVLASAYLIFKFRLAGVGAAISVIASLGASLLLSNVFGLTLGLTGVAAFFFAALLILFANYVILRAAKLNGSAPRAAVRAAFSEKKFFVVDVLLLPLAVAIAMMFYGNIYTALFSDLLFIGTLSGALSLLITYLTVGALSDAGKTGAQAFGN